MKILSFSAIALAAVAILSAQTGNRQVTQNDKSPSAKTHVAIGGIHNITIEYNAPSARGRKVEGGLIPYAQIYRMGADAATTMTTDGDIAIGDLKVPKGVHTLYLQASENGPWELVVNNQTKQWGTVYNKDQDLGRTAMKVTKLGSMVETFKITLAGKELSVEWGNTKATVPIKAE